MKFTTLTTVFALCASSVLASPPVFEERALSSSTPKTRTVTETAVRTVTKTAVKTTTAFKTLTEIKLSTVTKPITITTTAFRTLTEVKPSTVTNKPSTITTTIKAATPSCKVMSCIKSTVTLTATSTVTVASSEILETTSAFDPTASAASPSIPPTCTSSGNLIVNGGFETGSFAYWTTTGRLFAADRGRDPNHANYLRYDGDFSNASLSQVIHTVPSVTYDFSFQYRVDNTFENLNIGFVCVIGNYTLSQYTDQVVYGDAGKWFTRIGKFEAIEEVSSLLCSFSSTVEDHNSIAIDDLSISCSS